MRTGKSLGFVQEGSDAQYQSVKFKLLEHLKKMFNPEFLNRLDDTIVFRQLSRDDMVQIVEVLLRNFMTRLEVLDVKVVVSPQAKAFLVDHGFDPALGARPLKRAIQRYLEDPMSELILAHGIQKDAEINVGVSESELSFDVVTQTQPDSAQP
jgi:ATP-dependent Clp protease ATP-binding subunit ClpC